MFNDRCLLVLMKPSNFKPINMRGMAINIYIKNKTSIKKKHLVLLFKCSHIPITDPHKLIDNLCNKLKLSKNVTPNYPSLNSKQLGKITNALKVMSILSLGYAERYIQQIPFFLSRFPTCKIILSHPEKNSDGQELPFCIVYGSRDTSVHNFWCFLLHF